MYYLTPEALIRIEDASDPKRGFIMKPWGEMRGPSVLYVNYFPIKKCLEETGFATWRCFRLIHPDAITEV